MNRSIRLAKDGKLKKIPKWTKEELNSLMSSVEELIPDEEEHRSTVEQQIVKENIKEGVMRMLKSYGQYLDDESVKSLTKIIEDSPMDEIYDSIEEWFNNLMEPQPQTIVPLRGYQNSNPDFMKPGIIIGYGGKPFDINNLKPEDFSKETQARCTSRIFRYCGNTNLPLTVAQHCVIGAEFFLLMGRPDLARIFIRHEGGEAILYDIAKPVKNMLPDYEALQDRLDQFNAEVHDLPWPFPPEIKMLDRNCAQYEMTFMMSTNMFTDYWEPAMAEARFIETWDKIEHIIRTYYKD